MLYFDYDKFSQEIKRQKRRGYHSYRTLSKHTGIPFATLHRIVNNTETVSLRDVFTLCNKLDLNVYEFIDEKEQQLEMFR